MPETPFKYLQILKKKAIPTEEPEAPDERDAAIERLERELAEEAEHTTSLRKMVDELRFQAETLETSYAKQLEDARLRIEKAEQAIEAEKTRGTEFEQARKEALAALKNAEARIERLSAGADLMQTTGTPVSSSGGGGDAMSIDEMLAEATIAPESEQDKNNAQPAAEPEESAEDMLEPDLVFANKDET